MRPKPWQRHDGACPAGPLKKYWTVEAKAIAILGPPGAGQSRGARPVLHILDPSLYSLTIVMAIVTTARAGPLLRLIYPERFVLGDIAEADRAALGTAAPR